MTSLLRPPAAAGSVYSAAFVGALLKPDLETPALVLWGDRDDFGVPRLADESAALCADVRLRHLPDGTHWIVHDATDIVREEILDVLQRHGRP